MKINWDVVVITAILLALLWWATDVAFCNECVGPFQDPTCNYLKCMEGLCK